MAYQIAVNSKILALIPSYASTPNYFSFVGFTGCLCKNSWSDRGHNAAYKGKLPLSAPLLRVCPFKTNSCLCVWNSEVPVGNSTGVQQRRRQPSQDRPSAFSEVLGMCGKVLQGTGQNASRVEHMSAAVPQHNPANSSSLVL